MKKNYLIGVAILLLSFVPFQGHAQGTETFESPLPEGSTVFTRAGLTFDSQNATFDTEIFVGAGAGTSDRFIDNVDLPGTNVTYSLSITGGATLFTMQSLEMYVSSIADGAMPTDDGTVTFVGRTAGVAQFTYTKPTGTFPTVFGTTNGFFTLDFTAIPGVGDVSNMNIDEIEFTINGSFEYVAVDNFQFDNEVLANDPPEIQSISVIGTPSSTVTAVDFAVVFDEPAINVDTSDFAIDAVGTTGTISGISGSGTSYTVSVTAISGEGTISIDLIGGNDIEDTLGNTPSPAFTTGEAHVVSRCFQETFESAMIGDFMFASNGVPFTTGSANLDVEFFMNAGAGDSDQYLDNIDDQGTGKAYSITTTGMELFTVEAVELYLSSNTNGLPDPTDDGTITVRGKLAGSALYTITKNTGFPTSSGGVTNGFFTLDFATAGASDFSLINIDELEFELGGAFVYIAIDNFEHCEEVSTSSPPIVQSITLVGDPSANVNTVDYEVIFNENAINVSLDDFSVTTTGTATGTTTGISGTGNNYVITVTGIGGEGSVRLDLNSLTNIEDSDGNTPPDPFTSGEIHLVSSCNIETYESLTVGSTTYSTNGKMFDTATTNFSVAEFIGAGSGGSDRYLDNVSDQGTNKIYSISITDGSTMQMGSIELYTSSELDGANPTDDGTVTIRGKLIGATAYTITKSVGFPTTFGSTQGFFTIDFATDGTSDFSMIDVDEIELVMGGAFTYVALDNFKFCNESVPPMAVCQNFTGQLDATGSVTISASDIDNGSTDNVAIASLSVSPDTFDCTDVGTPVLVTLTVTDTSGNTDTCTATVTVEDNVAPTASCVAPFTVQLDAMGMASITAADIDNGSTDACGIASTSIDVTSFSCADVGAPVTVTLTVTDNNMNVSTCTTTVTVEDNVAPTASCVAPFTVQLDAMGMANITAADIDNGSADACGIASTSIDVTSFSCADVGAPVTVTLTVTDNNMNVSTCTTTVTVEDNVAPTASCVAPFTVQLDAMGMASITAADIDNGSTDACGIASTSIDVTSFSCADIGAPVTVTLTVTDNNMNVSTCTTTVTVEDNVAPTASCVAPFTVQLDAMGMANITAADIDNGSADACGIANTSIDVTSFSCADVGTPVTVTLTVTDNNMNVSTCTTTVTVEDNVAPTASCVAPFTVQLDAMGMATITAADIDNGSADACGIANTSIDVTSFSCADVGAPVTVTLTVTDNNTNVSTCTTTVTVEDNVAPTASCVAPFAVQLDAMGMATITTADIDNGSADACGIASTSIDVTSFSCADVGTPVTVTLTVTDNNMNVSTCTTTVTVEDMVAPIAAAMDITVQLDALGMAFITGADVDNGSTDNCSIDTLTVVPDAFDCSDIGTPVMVTLTVTDTQGNSTDTTATVTVEDTLGVTVISGPVDIFTGTGSNDTSCSTIVNYDVSLNAFVLEDNCSDPTMITITQTGGLGSGATFPVGTTTEAYTLTDVNGNDTIYTFNVSITDTTIPLIDCPTDLIVAGENGEFVIPDFTTVVSDNCSSGADLIVTQTPVAGTVVTDPSVNTVIITATDAAGNIANCEFMLSVDTTLGVEDVSVATAQISLYPNPATSQVLLEATGTAIKSATLFDINGRLITTKDYATTSRYSMDVTKLSEGVYYLSIQTEGAVVVKRFIKK